MSFPHRKKPCSECPWKVDNPPGKFTPERFKALAGTATDMATSVFACHMSKEEKPVACAGFLIQSGGHNLTVRFAFRDGFDPRELSTGGHDLYENYIEMACANGVDEDDPDLRGVRIDGQLRVGRDE